MTRTFGYRRSPKKNQLFTQQKVVSVHHRKGIQISAYVRESRSEILTADFGLHAGTSLRVESRSFHYHAALGGTYCRLELYYRIFFSPSVVQHDVKLPGH